MSIFESLNLPDDLENVKNLDDFAFELRHEIIKLVSKNGGHLASNLGVIEATISLLSVFKKKNDAIVWDVGHQCYAYKILTGRFDQINTIRKNGGLSGFSNSDESVYDKFKSGHSSNSISAALGLAEFKKKNGQTGKVVVFIGDGAMTGGLAFEGLNNSANFGNLVIILNDNSMSISKNVGAISRYFMKLRMRSGYLKTKRLAKNILKNLPLGSNIKRFIDELKFCIRTLIYKESTIFEKLGLKYYGPIDGHNIYDMIKVMSIARDLDIPVIIHIVTKKGKGYKFSEKSPSRFHGISKFNIDTGYSETEAESFSSVFGETLCEIAHNNKNIYAITAAMTEGTGLVNFSKNFPKRFFDVGIAESHAVTFAGGLAAAGLIPVFAVYSTFLQRAFDQLIHDVAMQNFKVIFAIDRAGLVGPDGESHQGLYDVSMFNIIPGIICYSPSFFFELEACLKLSITHDTSVAIRYPKGKELFHPTWVRKKNNIFDIYGKNFDVLVVTYGRIFSFVAEIFEKFPGKISILKLNMIIPIPDLAIKNSQSYRNIYFFEESNISGGIGEKFGAYLITNGFKGNFNLVAINGFVKHATVEEQLSKFNLDFGGIFKVLKKFLLT